MHTLQYIWWVVGSGGKILLLLSSHQHLALHLAASWRCCIGKCSSNRDYMAPVYPMHIVLEGGKVRQQETLTGGFIL
jgi:hypothetical protein